MISDIRKSFREEMASLGYKATIGRDYIRAYDKKGALTNPNIIEFSIQLEQSFYFIRYRSGRLGKELFSCILTYLEKYGKAKGKTLLFTIDQKSESLLTPGLQEHGYVHLSDTFSPFLDYINTNHSSLTNRELYYHPSQQEKMVSFFSFSQQVHQLLRAIQQQHPVMDFSPQDRVHRLFVSGIRIYFYGKNYLLKAEKRSFAFHREDKTYKAIPFGELEQLAILFEKEYKLHRLEYVTSSPDYFFTRFFSKHIYYYIGTQRSSEYRDNVRREMCDYYSAHQLETLLSKPIQSFNVSVGHNLLVICYLEDGYFYLFSNRKNFETLRASKEEIIDTVKNVMVTSKMKQKEHELRHFSLTMEETLSILLKIEKEKKHTCPKYNHHVVEFQIGRGKEPLSISHVAGMVIISLGEDVVEVYPIAQYQQAVERLPHYLYEHMDDAELVRQVQEVVKQGSKER